MIGLGILSVAYMLWTKADGQRFLLPVVDIIQDHAQDRAGSLSGAECGNGKISYLIEPCKGDPYLGLHARISIMIEYHPVFTFRSL